ncbi:hypothetical protein [Pseudomonas californiensis]|uniref:hypothetical protein n=1 Tax=Pseudomonas californiensis TaxID=2829823 RepID=UPI001E55DF51|nr:hypothetical protein [Pseudomonas californiensis]
MMENLLLAALPVVAANGAAIDPQRWAAIEASVKSAVECRAVLPAAKLKDIAPGSPGSWTLTPPTTFTVFGLPVARVEVFIDPDGELGASYTAVFEKVSLQKLQQQLKKANQKGLVGDLAAGQAFGPQQVEASCVIAE